MALEARFGALRAIYVASVHNLKFPFAAFSIVKTKKPVQGALGGIRDLRQVPS
jgi:hypothetical protein